jgi:GNAT superfamily N-acetyltransferase
MIETIIVPHAPMIAGLNFRQFRGEEDFPHMAKVISASANFDGNERATTVDDIRTTYSHFDRCDPLTDMLMAEVDGELIAYSRVTWDQQSDGVRTYFLFGFLLPEWRRKGIGTAMLRWNENRLREIAAEQAYDGPKFFQSYAGDSEKGTIAMLEKEGYTAARWGFNMKRGVDEPLPESPMPAGLEVRPAQKEHYRAIWDAMQEAFRDHWGYVPGTEENYKEWQEEKTFQPDIWKVAWEGNQVAGMVLNFIDEDENVEYNRRRGYTEGISVRRPWRKHGLARSLLVQSIQMFREMGMTETALGVDAHNLSGALNLYKGVGYHTYKTGITYRKPLE